MIKLKYTLPLIGILLITTPNALAFETIKGAALKIEQSHDKLIDIKDNDTISPEERESRENLARKDIIKNAISLSLTEVKTLRSSLTKLPEFAEESKEQKLKDRYEEELDVYSAYYENQALRLAELDESEAMKNLAKEIINYRDNIYNPAVGEITDLTLLFYTEDVVATADSRLIKIAADIKKLERLNIIKPNQFKTKTDKASDFIQSASAKHLKAKDSILSRADVIIASETPNEEAADVEILEEIQNEIVEQEPALTPRELIEMSLTDVKSAYEIFLQISRDIRRISGLR